MKALRSLPAVLTVASSLSLFAVLAVPATADEPPAATSASVAAADRESVGMVGSVSANPPDARVSQERRFAAQFDGALTPAAMTQRWDNFVNSEMHIDKKAVDVP